MPVGCLWLFFVTHLLHRLLLPQLYLLHGTPVRNQLHLPPAMLMQAGYPVAVLPPFGTSMMARQPSA